MVDKELKDYIERNFKKNSPEKKIKSELTSLGWKYYEINEALEEFNNKPVESIKKEKTYFLKIFTIIFLLIIIFVGGAYYYFILSGNYSNSGIYFDNNTIYNGVFLPVVRESKINFYYGEDNLSFVINSIGFKSFNIKNSENLKIGLGESKYLDLNNDSKSDIYIRGVLLDIGKINLSIQSLDLIGCPENWYCSGWSACLNETQNRSCVDLNLCQTNKNQPFLNQKCVEKPIVIINESNSNKGTSISNNNLKIKDKLKKQPNSFEDLTGYFDCGFENSTIVNECLIQAVDSCNKSKLINKIELGYEGFLFNSMNVFAIKEGPDNSCYYYQKNLNSFLEFSPELVQNLVDQGYSEEEIFNEEKAMNESAQNFVGLWTQCSFEKENLKKVFESWKNGNYQGGENCDFINGELFCQYSGDFASAIECNSGI